MPSIAGLPKPHYYRPGLRNATGSFGRFRLPIGEPFMYAAFRLPRKEKRLKDLGRVSALRGRTICPTPGASQAEEPAPRMHHHGPADALQQGRSLQLSAYATASSIAIRGSAAHCLAQ